MSTLFHLITPDDWAAALDSGWYAPPSLAAEGFIHFSFSEQVAATANRHYAGAVELSVVELDPGQFGHPVVCEDTTGRGEEYPHVYGAIPTSAAVSVRALARDEAGNWVFG